MAVPTGTATVSPSLIAKLRAAGYAYPEDVTGQTIEEFLSTCRLSIGELRELERFLAESGASWCAGPVRYPFVSPLLLKNLAASGIDCSRMSITTIGLPAWAEAPLLAGEVKTLAQLAGSSTFAVRTILGYGGRPQSILRQNVEEHLLGLLSSVQLPDHTLLSGGTPLNGLPISSRTLNALRRSGVFTVEQLQRMTDTELARLRGLGAKGIAEIRSALPPHAQTPTTEGATDIVLQAETVGVRPEVARRSVRELDIPASLAGRLERVGVRTIGDIVGDGDGGLAGLPRIGAVSVDRVRAALERYLLATLEEVGESVPEIVAEVSAEAALSTLDARIVSLLRRLHDARLQRLLERRFGLKGDPLTLEQAGKELGVTRERARQLERAAILRLRRDRPQEVEGLTRPPHEALAAAGGVAPISYLAEQLPTLFRVEEVSPAGAMRFLAALAAECKQLSGKRYALLDAPLEQVERIDAALVALLRKRMRPLPISALAGEMATLSAYAAVVERFPSFSLAARARANPHTYVLPSGYIALREWRRTRLDDAYAALRELGQPTHFTLIAEHVRRALPEGEAFSVDSLHNLLLSEAAFVRAGKGQFGLAEWQEADPELSEQLAALLRDAAGPVHYAELARTVGRDARSVERCLIRRPEFFPAGRGAYGILGRAYPRTVARRAASAARSLVRAADRTAEGAH